MAEAGAEKYLRRNGWLKLYRSDASFRGTAHERALAQSWGIPHRAMDLDGARALEPSLNPVFRHAVHWEGTASVSNPLAVTQAYARRFNALGGVTLTGDARTLHRADGSWRIDTESGHLDAQEVVIALGPWGPDLLERLDIRLPLAIKRGYHRHYTPTGNASLARPVLDLDGGYVLAPMEQGVRLTTGAEFAARDAAPTPVQFDRLMPAAKELFPLGAPVEPQPWIGARPCFADSRPVIDRAPNQSGLWLAYGHGHWGLTLGPATGRLLAEMMTGGTPFMDPAPFRATRFAA
jgi:D-amino-acid dehydrogenase